VSVEIAGTEIWLGSAEIHAFSQGGKIFSAPNLVYHYVERHGYRPPDEFVQAVIDGAEGRVNDSTVHRLRALLNGSPRVGDRVDAAIDLMQISPDSAASWIAEIIAPSSCEPYLKHKLGPLIS
jgi:hypothetical protein